MTLHTTGHAEIDQQHEILEATVARLEALCPEGRAKPNVDCAACTEERRQQCRLALSGIATDLETFLVGHAAYEEKMMELLPDTPTCQAHIRAHKAAHDGIARQLKKMTAQVREQSPREGSMLLWRVIETWLGDHTARFDQSLVQLGHASSAEINFDAELVAMLDQHVFPNRPTAAKRLSREERSRQWLETRGRIESLSPAQREVFRLVICGKRNREIADALGVSVNTVKTHRAAIFAKMQVHSVVELLQKTEVLR